MKNRKFSLKHLPPNCSQEWAETINKWCMQIWDASWLEYAPVSNARAEFLHYLLRDHKELDETLLNKIKLAVEAFTTFLREKKKAGDKLVGVQTLSVWYNQGKYDQEIITESSASLRERQNQKTCRCGQTIDHAGTGECWTCYIKRTEDRDKIKENLKKLELYKEGQSLREVSQNCREYSLSKNASSIVVQTVKKLQMNSIDSELKSSPQNVGEDSGSSQTHPVGSKEWFEQNYPDMPTEYDREQGLHLLGEKK